MINKDVFALPSICSVAVTADRPVAAREQFVSVHPYDVPEVVALPVVDGHHPDLQWVTVSTRIP